MQDKEAKSGKSEEKEAKEGSEPDEQEDPDGKDEGGPEEEDSETDYSSAEENILTKAGRRSGCPVRNGDRTWERVCLSSVGFSVFFYPVTFKSSLLDSSSFSFFLGFC